MVCIAVEAFFFPRLKVLMKYLLFPKVHYTKDPGHSDVSVKEKHCLYMAQCKKLIVEVDPLQSFFRPGLVLFFRFFRLAQASGLVLV